MRKLLLIPCLITTCLGLSLQANAQFKEIGTEVGVAGGATVGLSESEEYAIRPMVRAYFAHPILDMLQGELGVGFGLIRGENNTHEAEVVPIEYRFKFSPVASTSVIPYLYAGVGGLYYDVQKLPPTYEEDAELSGWAPFIPYGVGLQVRASEAISFDLHGGHNFTFNDALNPQNSDDDDSYATGMLGLRFSMGSPYADPDKDGLINKEEKQLGTDRKNPDSDGDQLLDGEEVNTHSTDPLNADTDGDDLNDYSEIFEYKTNPGKADSDGDKLSDGDEVKTHMTEPTKADTDGDGLDDYEELMTYTTDPLKVDSDDDGLNDQEEVIVHGTDPNKADTDGGSISDGNEVTRGSNPLDAEDDVPVIEVDKGESIVLEGVVFNSGSSEILPASESTLMQAFYTLQQYPEIKVLIEGHTDKTGGYDLNMRLSQQRANSVMNWLIEKGVDPDRISAKGLGPDHPIAPNNTREGRAQNRRIEFMRVDE